MRPMPRRPCFLRKSNSAGGRRLNLWVVPVEAVVSTDYEDADLFQPGTDKSYREAFGYETTKRAKAAGDAAEI